MLFVKHKFTLLLHVPYIERKIVHVDTEQIIRLFKEQVYVELKNFSLTFIDAEDYATSEKWQQKYCYVLSVHLGQR
jgi:hypothetical protein